MTKFMDTATSSQTNKVIAAEVKMTRFIAMHNLPFSAADHLSELLPSDLKIAADFSCKRTKTKAIICDALEPYLKRPVIEYLRTSPFNLLCDESNERGDSVKLLTVLARAFDPVNGVVVTRHLDTVGITDLTGEGIFTALKEVIEHY